MSLSKILKNTAFRDQVQRTFALHRDLRSCLSLTDAEKFVSERQQQIKEYGKTAFLEFLNNFPLNYSYKTPGSPLNLYLRSLQLKDLSTYQEMLRLSALSKLKEYIWISHKSIVQGYMKESEKALINIIQTKPFDTTHAINFLLMQKDSYNSKLFYHCLDVIKKGEYKLFTTISHKTIPIFTKRLSMQEWNIIRRFDYFIEILTFDYVPNQAPVSYYPHLIQKISAMMLHTVCYHKIPPAIDFVIGYYYQQICNNQELDISKLHLLLKVFENLPIGYNQKAFNAFFNKLMQKSLTEVLHYQELPYRRMTTLQKQTIFKTFKDKDAILYYGNHYLWRKEALQSQIPKKINDSLMKISSVNRGSFCNYIVMASFLFQYYKNESKQRNAVREKFKEIFEKCDIEFGLSSLTKFISVQNLLNLIFVQRQIRMDKLEQFINKVRTQILEKANGEHLKEANLLQNVVESMYLYADSPIAQIRQQISELLIKIVKNSQKLYFSYYSEIILTFCKSEYYNQYETVVDEVIKTIPKEDICFMVQLYHLYPNKSMKLFTNLLKLIIRVDPSFRSISRFMTSSTYTTFTSSRGQLKLEFRKILQEIEPTMSVNQLEGFKMPELTLILRFCHHFYFYASEFARKFLTVALSYAQSLDLGKDKGAFALEFIQEASALKYTSNSPSEVSIKIVSLLKKLSDIFSDNILLKIKQIELKWVLDAMNSKDRISLVVDEVLQEISNSNYSEKHGITMVLLLKLHALGIIKLKKIIEDKLQSFLISYVQNNSLKTGDIVNQLFLPFRRGGSSVETTNGNAVSNVLIASLKSGGMHHNFSFYFKILQFANFMKSSDLVAQVVESMSEAHMSPSQIKAVIKILCYYRNICFDKFAKKLLKDTNALFSYLRQDCAAILYIVHLAKNQTTAEEEELTKILLNKHSDFLKDEIKNEESDQVKILDLVIKHVWVSLKINQLNVNMSYLLKFLIRHYSIIKDQVHRKSNFIGLPQQSIALIYLSVLKWSQINDPSFNEQFKTQEKRPFFSKKKKETPQQLKYIQQECKIFFDFIIKQYSLEQQKMLRQALTKQGLKEMTPQNKSEDNIFELKKSLQGLILNGWVRKDNKQYGIMHINDRYLGNHSQFKGRLNFNINCLSIITQLKIIVFQAGKDLSIQ